MFVSTHFFYVSLQCVILSSYIWTMICSIFTIDMKESSSSKSLQLVNKHPWVFFTNWNLVMQMYFLLHSIVHELVFKIFFDKTDVFMRKSEEKKNFIFMTIVFPATCAVAVTFWSIYFYDREQIYPSIFDAHISYYHNIIVHAFIFLPVLLEFSYKKVQPGLIDPKIAFATIIYDLAYTILFVCWYLIRGEWIYLIFDVSGWPLKIFLTSLPCVFKIVCLTVLYTFDGWTKKNSNKTKTKKKRSQLINN